MYVCTSVSSLLSQRTELAEEFECPGLQPKKKFLHCLSISYEPGDGLF